MAEVTGQIGDQQVQLKNAATEVTLKQLLQATMSMAQKMGVDVKGQAKLQKELEKLSKEVKKNDKELVKANKQKERETKNSEALAAAKKKEEEITEKSAQATKFFVEGVGRAADKALEYAGKLTSVISSFANMGNSMSGAASVFGNIPVVGGLLSQSLGAVAGAADKLYDSFRSASSVGANFGGSIRTMVDAASGAGLTFDQFANVVKNNSEALIFLGATSSDGAQRLASLGKQIRSKEFKNLNDDLARLGFSTEDVNNGLGHYSMLMAKSGTLQGMSDKDLIASTGEYLKNLDAVSKLTGKSKEAMQAEEKARQTDAQFRVIQAKAGKEGAGRLNALMNSMGPGMQKAFQAYAATGTAFNDQAKALAVSNPEAARAMEKFHRQMQESGTVTEEMMYELDEALKASSKSASKSAVTQSLATFQADKYGEVIVDQMNLSQREGTLRESRMKSEKEMADARAKAQKAEADGLDPANMKRFQENIAELSNRFTKLLGENMPKLEKLFSALSDFIAGPAMTAFTFFIKHLEYFAGAILVIVGLLTGLKTVLTALQAFKDWKKLGGEPGHPGGPPLRVTEVGPTGGKGGLEGDVDKDGKGKGGKGKGALKAAGRFAKGAGAVGAVVGGAMLYSDLSDISEREKKGEITAEQAKTEKGGAVGSAGGGLAGGIAGAAAGAALGSVVPVIGTVVGGVVGGLIGGFGGSFFGQKAGEALAAPSTPAGAPVTATAKGTYEINGKPVTKEQYDAHNKATAERMSAMAANKPTATLAGLQTPAALAGLQTPAALAGLQTPAALAGLQTPAAAEIKSMGLPIAEAEKMKQALAAAGGQSADFAKRESEYLKMIAQMKEAETKKPPDSQERVLTELKNLNSNINTMIAKQTEAIGILTNQLSVQRTMTGSLSMDLFTAA